jgi:hypothetical protein
LIKPSAFWPTAAVAVPTDRDCCAHVAAPKTDNANIHMAILCNIDPPEFPQSFV